MGLPLIDSNPALSYQLICRQMTVNMKLLRAVCQKICKANQNCMV